MKYEINPKYEIENAIYQTSRKTENKKDQRNIFRKIRIRPNPIKIIYKTRPITRLTEDQKIKHLEYKIYRIENLLKHQLNSIESIKYQKCNK